MYIKFSKRSVKSNICMVEYNTELPKRIWFNYLTECDELEFSTVAMDRGLDYRPLSCDVKDHMEINLKKFI